MSVEDYEQAEQYLLADSLRDAQAWAMLAECRFHRGDYSGQLEASEMSLALSNVYHERVAHYLHEGYVAQLTSALEAVESGNDLEVSKLLSETIVFGQAITTEMNPRIAATNARLPALAAATALKLKDNPRAETYLNGLHKQWQNRPELLERLAHTYYQMGQRQSCVDVCEHVLLQQPDNSAVLNLRAQALRGSDRQAATLNAYRDALESFGDQPLMQREMGMLLFELGEWKQAEQSLELAYRSGDADSLDLLILMAECAFNDGGYLQALEHYQHALRIQPMSRDVLRAIGACHWRLGEPKEAKAAFELAAKMSEGQPATARPSNGQTTAGAAAVNHEEEHGK